MAKTVGEMFKDLKKAINKRKVSDDEIDTVLDNIDHLLPQAEAIGQTAMTVQLKAQQSFAQRMKDDIVPAGLRTTISYDQLDKAIHSADDYEAEQLLMKTLAEYTRLIPDKNMAKINDVKDLFDDIIIVYTDQSGTERKVADDIKKEKDPIAFGIMRYAHDENIRGIRNGGITSDDLVFITDWVDEYSDLTLGKLLTEYDIKVNTWQE